ncbi:MAG: DUF2764 domain-containing protein [Treponema sp.]|jgi:hypothetical protein|nr:DUF2764 domain-containing protein [Treponema sp.]
MAQLPFLIYEQKPPMPSAVFKALAETQLNEEDAAFLNCLSLDPDPDGKTLPSYAEPAPSTGCVFIDNWREWERSLRLNLAKNRAIKLKRDNLSALEPPFYPVDAVTSALKSVNADISPLEGETLIDKARWNAIDTFAGNDYFDRNSVFAYFLKLMLIERRVSFNAERGFAEYKSLYASIIESGHNSLGVPK